MALFKKLLQNHPLANLAFALLVALGLYAYQAMPRAQFPEVNFNWVLVVTVWPGASASDIEKRVTDPLENAVVKVGDVKFSSSTSREHYSVVLLRFRDLSQAAFDRRMNDLRREVQLAATTHLPREAQPPMVTAITTSSGFPTALVVARSESGDGRLYRFGETAREDMERLPGVDKVHAFGMRKRELVVDFSPDRLERMGLRPDVLAQTLRTQLQDASGGSALIDGQNYVLRVWGAESDAGRLAELPVAVKQGKEVLLGHVATVRPGLSPPAELVRHAGVPAVLLAVTKQPDASALSVVEEIKAYIDDRNRRGNGNGLSMLLLDDQTHATEDAIEVMQNNAAMGLALVLAIAWFFLGRRMSLVIALGVPFSLAGTFFALHLLGQGLNVAVLLGVVIALGMMVDQGVVVVEVVYRRMLAGMDAVDAGIAALREVALPVTAAVLTTVAAFLPLLLLPGVLGKFMAVVPLVVTLALVGSLTQAFWILPSHVSALHARVDSDSAMRRLRLRFARRLGIVYGRALTHSLRHPARLALAVLLLFALAGTAWVAGWVRVQFFAFDAMRVFNVNVEMAPGTPLEETLRVARDAEERVRRNIRPEELRSTLTVVGQTFTATEQLSGAHLAQITVSLKPANSDMRSTEAIVEAMRREVISTPGPRKIAFQLITGGPPVQKPVSVKVRGEDFTQVQAAVSDLTRILRDIPAIRDITDDSRLGAQEITLRLDHREAAPLSLDPVKMAGMLRLFMEGVVITSVHDERGEKLDVRLRAVQGKKLDMDSLLGREIALPEGGKTTLGRLFTVEMQPGLSTIRHYNMRRAVAVEADLDKSRMDTTEANAAIRAGWDVVRDRYPDVDLDFSGELDDIKESLGALGWLFLVGVGLIYLILAAQFRSYFQPLLILTTIPVTFASMVYGLWIGGHPLSLITMYGAVALGGVAVASAIVLIDAANERLRAGMNPLHATFHAARRRLVPILITSFADVAGALPLAAGWGGKSLIWSPLASAIVWGRGIATILTLFLIPTLYYFLVKERAARVR
jgi:multidrug efflux pump subunit AcrB